MKKSAPYVILLLLLAAGFSLATVLQGRADTWSLRGQSGSLLAVLLGDGRRLFANHFFVQADISFHSGYYPSIFDQARANRDYRHLTSKEDHADHPEDQEHTAHPDQPQQEEHHDHEAHRQHEKLMDFLGPPRDYIERFGRRFMVTEHTHLEGRGEREILPWLKISSLLDPQKVETYVVAAYWLRNLGKLDEAKRFLRQGMLSNPDSYEILFELGRLYYESNRDPARARRIWNLALRRWDDQAKAHKKPDPLKLDQIAVNLAHLEESEGNLPRAIQLLELARQGSPHPEALQKQIDDLRQRLAAPPAAPAPQPR